ncbi:serine/threonine protein kinase [Calothrix sp. NIES-3974]|uniref:serine/threonine protein kinase n=1 Tax=Calothrix sp. NIES-3974 TaxID=2005462 RepID=UPI000B5E59BE|nr:serine/threonine-protein kinase [Calothrix sp. NIES-3974]BAZ06317.1 serine/threonine protein kinase [Calothrix sp. NIES-3974]
MSHVKHSAIHCINPECANSFPQPWGNRFCTSCGAQLELLERYVPLKRLGSGGFAQIYTVWDLVMQVEKVLKVLIEDSPKALELFAQEAEVLCHLEHPGVPQVDVCGDFQVQVSYPRQRVLSCLVMEKIEGLTLEEIQRHYPQGCPQGLIINWLTQAIDILEHLHERNIIHRDIKPSNMMLRSAVFSRGGTRGDQLVLIDFGGVKQFSSGRLRLTVRSTRLFSSGYSPPEQLIGGYVGPQADFYALGRTIIELLTGKNPTELEDAHTGKLEWRHLVTVKPKLADLLDEMVHLDMRSRPANAAIIKRRLQQISIASNTQPIFAQLQGTVQQKINQTISQVSQRINSQNINTSHHHNTYPITQFVSQASGHITNAVNTAITAVSQTIIVTLRGIRDVAIAVFSIILSMLLASIGATLGTIIGFLIAYQTRLGTGLSQFIQNRFAAVIPNTVDIAGAEILLFIAAGLGTTWGLTTAGAFGQKRQYISASVTSIIGYGLGWLALQLLTSNSQGEGIMGLILIAVSCSTLGLGFKSHKIVYAVTTAFGTALSFAILIYFGFFPIENFALPMEPIVSNLPLKIIFFTLAGILTTLFLALSHYVIVPGLKALGWR